MSLSEVPSEVLSEIITFLPCNFVFRSVLSVCREWNNIVTKQRHVLLRLFYSKFGIKRITNPDILTFDDLLEGIQTDSKCSKLDSKSTFVNQDEDEEYEKKFEKLKNKYIKIRVSLDVGFLIFNLHRWTVRGRILFLVPSSSVSTSPDSEEGVYRGVIMDIVRTSHFSISYYRPEEPREKRYERSEAIWKWMEAQTPESDGTRLIPLEEVRTSPLYYYGNKRLYFGKDLSVFGVDSSDSVVKYRLKQHGVKAKLIYSDFFLISEYFDIRFKDENHIYRSENVFRAKGLCEVRRLDLSGGDEDRFSELFSEVYGSEGVEPFDPNEPTEDEINNYFEEPFDDPDWIETNFYYDLLDRTCNDIALHHQKRYNMFFIMFRHREDVVEKKNKEMKEGSRFVYVNEEGQRKHWEITKKLKYVKYRMEGRHYWRV